MEGLHIQSSQTYDAQKNHISNNYKVHNLSRLKQKETNTHTHELITPPPSSFWNLNTKCILDICYILSVKWTIHILVSRFPSSQVPNTCKQSMGFDTKVGLEIFVILTQHYINLIISLLEIFGWPTPVLKGTFHLHNVNIYTIEYVILNFGMWRQ